MSRKFQDSEMAIGLILIIFSFMATANAECQIHDNYHIYYDITDLGVAALHNDVELLMLWMILSERVVMSMEQWNCMDVFG